MKIYLCIRTYLTVALAYGLLKIEVDILRQVLWVKRASFLIYGILGNDDVQTFLYDKNTYTLHLMTFIIFGKPIKAKNSLNIHF